MNQFISRVSRSSCLRFVITWFFQVRLLSKWSPRYLTVSAWGTTVWLMYTGGQCPRRRVNVTSFSDVFLWNKHLLRCVITDVLWKYIRNCLHARCIFRYIYIIKNFVSVMIFKVKKITLSRYRPGVAQRVGRGIAQLFHDRCTRRGWVGPQHAPAALYARERPGKHFTY
jgi:hypothetical protein